MAAIRRAGRHSAVYSRSATASIWPRWWSSWPASEAAISQTSMRPRSGWVIGRRPLFGRQAREEVEVHRAERLVGRQRGRRVRPAIRRPSIGPDRTAGSRSSSTVRAMRARRPKASSTWARWTRIWPTVHLPGAWLRVTPDGPMVVTSVRMRAGVVARTSSTSRFPRLAAYGFMKT